MRAYWQSVNKRRSVIGAVLVLLLIVAVIVAVSCSVAAARSKQSASNFEEMQAVQHNESSAVQHNNSSNPEDSSTSTLSATINMLTSSTEGRQANVNKRQSNITSQRRAAQLLELLAFCHFTKLVDLKKLAQGSCAKPNRTAATGF